MTMAHTAPAFEFGIQKGSSTIYSQAASSRQVSIGGTPSNSFSGVQSHYIPLKYNKPPPLGTDKDREAQLVSGALTKGLGGWWQQKHHLYSMCWVKHMTSVPSHLPETGHIWREWALDCFSLCSPPPQTSIPSLDPEPYLSLASHVVTPKFTSSNPTNHRRDWWALGCRLINGSAGRSWVLEQPGQRITYCLSTNPQTLETCSPPSTLNTTLPGRD